MLKIVHIQSVATEEDVEKLKAAARTHITKDAVTNAVDFYINVMGALTDEHIKALQAVTGVLELDAAILKAIREYIKDGVNNVNKNIT